jgi:hypothetical protein
MRCLGLAVVLSLPSGCYFGPGSSGSGTPYSDASGSDATGSEGGSDPATGPGDPTGASDPTEGTGSPQTSAATETGGSTDGPADSGESTGGEMSGCETGPLPGPIPGCAPAPMPSSGDIHQDCVDRINQFRWECQCLPPLARWSDGETCTDQQSAADQSSGQAHGNFGMCGENAQNTCPNWGSEQDVIVGCLQAMWDEGPGEPFSEHGHYINMSSLDYSRVACGFSSSGGGVWANQNFSP